MTKIKYNCRNLKYVKIPSSNAEVTKKYPNVIFMEYINGIPINKILEDDYEAFAKQVLKFGFVTTLIHGVLHADLHSGNILFVKDLSDEKYKHKIGVIDFGIIYELNENYKNNLFDVMSDIFSTPCDLTARKILYSGVLEPLSVIQTLESHHVENIVSILANVIKECVTVKKKASQTQLYNFFTKLTNYLNQNDISNLGLKPSDDLVKSQLVLAMSHGVSLSLCKSDFASVANKVLNELFHTELLDE
jgi:predicted unusual protein kinase regulating ubiquinone biosynthesis (AarF/ABC1/UbiB family)